MSMGEGGQLPAAAPPPPEVLVELAQREHTAIVAVVQRMRTLWLELAERLYHFNRNEGWRKLGYQTFEAYLQDPVLEIGRRYAYDLIAMYAQLVVERGVDTSRLQQLDVSKVREVLPAIRHGLPAEEALSDAEVLTRPDLEAKYRGLASSNGATPGTDEGGSRIETAAAEEWATCECCGRPYRRMVNAGR